MARQPLAADRFIDFRVVRDDIFYSIYSIHFPADGKFGPNVLVGWQNRIMIVTQALWVILMAYEVNRQKKQTMIFA